MRRTRLPWRLAAAIAGANASIVHACPVCNTGVGEQVRAGIFDGHFGYNLLITLVPFAVFAGIGAIIHFGWPLRRSGRATASAKGPGSSSPQTTD